MSKPKGDLVVTARSPRRHERHEYDRAVELFVSVGYFMAEKNEAALIAHVANYCFEHGMRFSYEPYSDGSTRIARIM